jgi:hypothetical protein
LTLKAPSGSVWAWKSPLPASNSGPTPRRAESDFLSAITPEILTLLLWLVLDALVTNIPGEILTKYGKEIQSTYNSVRPKSLPPIEEDGYIGFVSSTRMRTELICGPDPQDPPQQ